MGEGQCEKTMRFLTENITEDDGVLTMTFVVQELTEEGLHKDLYHGERQVILTTRRSQNSARTAIRELMVMWQEIKRAVVASEEKVPIRHPLRI